MKLSLIGAFGILGVFARYFMGLLLEKQLPDSFPYGTLFINISGSFLIGIIYILGDRWTYLSPDVRFAIMTGFLGGYTTFSSLTLEAVKLGETRGYHYSALYLAVSPLLGFVATLLGVLFGRKVLGGLL